MSSISGAAGHAALAICKSMLLSLTENKIIDKAEARAILARRGRRPSQLRAAAGGRRGHEQAASLIDEFSRGATQCGIPELEPRSNLS